MRNMPWLLLAALLAAGCGPDRTPPVQTMAMVLSDKGVYEPKQVSLTTVTSISELKGSVATLIGGGRIVVDPNDPLLASSGGSLTDEQFAQILLKSKGIPPRGSYVENNGVLWPADFHTWNMVTTYYNFEKAFEYFQGIGVTAAEMGSSTVYYFPYFVMLEQGPNPLEDNALFFSPIQAFMVLPFKALQAVPLSMNYGVVAHEYSHRVFNKRVYQGRAFPEPLIRWIGGGLVATPAANILKSMDEGLADWNAYGATCLGPYGCNTRFLSASIPPTETDARDMAKNDKCMTAGLRNNLNTLGIGDFSRQGLEYQVGTVLASALYHAANKTGQRGVLQKAVLAAYSDPDPATPGFAQLITSNLATPENFTLAAVANAILTHITEPDLKKEMCNEFMDRLKLAKSDMPACPAASVGGTNCPALPPQ